MNYLVRDDEGAPLRAFWTLHEAHQFKLPGYTVERITPSTPLPEPLTFQQLIALCGESPY